jgi:uncharacterized RDD family membrane protein YckC
MKRPGPPQGDLLNLPLTDTGDRSVAPRQPFEAQDLLPFDSAEPDEIFEEDVAAATSDTEEPSFGRRFKAGLLDIATVSGTVFLATVGSSALGARLDPASIPAFVLFAVSFSFLYTIVPLTFWGQTPGMAIMRLVVRARNDAPLTIQQGIRRWLGALATVLLCGLPVLLILTGRSLADHLSDSRVRVR